MVSAIDLGRIFSSGDKTVVGGSASGLDTESIVNALIDARKIPVTKLQDTVDANAKKLSAYQEMKTLLNDFKAAAKQLSNPAGFNNATQNAFAYVKGTITSNTSVAGSQYLSVTAAAGADVSDYKITVDKLAKAKIQTTSTSFASTTTSVVEAAGGATAGLFSAGDLTLNALGTPVAVTLQAGDTLLDIQSKINNVSGLSGVRASIIQVSAGDFRLQLQSTQTGISKAYTMTDDGSGVFAQVAFNNTQVADDSQITFNGLTVTRTTNAISDLVDDVTFNLLSVTPVATELTASITPDTETITQSIQDFVDAYNEFRLFVAKQRERGDDGLPTETAILSGDSTLNTIVNQVARELSRSVKNITAGDADSLGIIGITMTDFAGDAETPAVDNILSLDAAKLTTALQTNFDAVRRVFEFDMTSDSPNLTVFSRTNALSQYNFTLNVNVGLGTATATYNPGGGPVTVALTYAAITGGGATIGGVAGTPFEGLSLIYSGSVNDTINVNITQGIADTLFNTLELDTDDIDGLMANATSALTDENTRIQEKIEKLNTSIEEYRQQLLDKFANLEKAISQSNYILQSLAAQDNARQNN